MAREATQNSSPREFMAVPRFNFGSELDALTSARKILLESYEETMRRWFERVETEASLWSELPARMAGSCSIATALKAYSDCVSRQMQMSMEDGQQLVEDYRRITRRVVNSLQSERSATRSDPEFPPVL